MNTIQKIMNVLMNPNAELTNIIMLVFFLVEVFIYVNIFTVLLNIHPSKKINIHILFYYSLLLRLLNILFPFHTIQSLIF